MKDLREPGEDPGLFDEPEERGAGEYYERPAGTPEPLGVDHCGCPKPADAWGRAGHHFRPNPAAPQVLALAVAYEACPAYARALGKGAPTHHSRRRLN